MRPSGTIVGVLVSAALVVASTAVPTTGSGRAGPPAAGGPAVVDGGLEATRTSMALVGARTPGQPVSFDLLLHDAEIVLLERNDPEAEPHAKLRFASPVDEIVEEDGFFVVTANPATAVRSVAASLAEDDRAAAIVRFPPGTDLAQHTVAGAEAGAVRTVDGKGNPVTTTPLSTLDGATVAPELTSVTTRSDTNWITYRFTAHLAHDRRPRPERFGFYSADGMEHRAAAVVSAVDDTVVARFEQDGRSSVRDAVRMFVDHDAVHDLQGHGNSLGVAGVGTVAPDPVHAERRSPTVFRFTFDEPVTDVDPRRFVVRAVNGGTYEGTEHALLRDGRTVDVVFPRLFQVSNAVTVATVLPGAARASGPFGPDATAGSFELGVASASLPGTAGPDLVGFTADETVGFVTARFDEALDHARFERIDPAAFALLSASGNTTPAVFVVDLDPDGEALVLAFPRAATTSARALTVAGAGVTDRQGNPNPPSTVLRRPDPEGSG